MNCSARFNPVDRTTEIKFADDTTTFSKKFDMASLRKLKEQIDDACWSNDVVSYFENSDKYANAVLGAEDLMRDVCAAYRNRKCDDAHGVWTANATASLLDEIVKGFDYDLSYYEYEERVKYLLETVTDYDDSVLDDEDLISDICERYKANETAMTFDEIIGEFKDRLAKYA